MSKSQYFPSALLDFTRYREPFMAMFQAYFDESGKHVNEPIVTFCGVASPLSHFQNFDDEWNGILRRYDLPLLTMKKALRTSRPLSSVIRAESQSDRIEHLKPFADCIRDYLELGIAIALDVKGFKALPSHMKNAFAGGGDNPHFMAFLQGLAGIKLYVKPEDHVGVICDDDEETAINCFRFYRRVRYIDPVAKKNLVAISFAEDAEFPALQAADFISSLIRYEAAFAMFGERYAFRDLFLYLVREGDPAKTFRWHHCFWDKAKLAATPGELARLTQRPKRKSH